MPADPAFEWRWSFDSSEVDALHAELDFDDHLRDFCFTACGFEPTNAGLVEL